MNADAKILKYLGKNGPTSSRDLAIATELELTLVRNVLADLAKKGAVAPPGQRGKTLYALPTQKVVNGNGTPVAANGTKPGIKKATAPAPKPAPQAAKSNGSMAATHTTADALKLLKAERAQYESLVTQVTNAAGRAEKVRLAIEALEGNAQSDKD